MPVQLIAVTDTVHLAHTDLVNWTIVADDTGVMLIDAGFPGSRDEVLTSLRWLGFGPPDVRAILLTHAHVDHLGSAIWFAATHGTPVYCHADEVGHSKREYLQQASPVDLLPHAWQPRWIKWSLAIARKVSHGSQSVDGRETRSVLMSVLHTLYACCPDPAARLKSALDRYAQNPQTNLHAAIFAGLMLHAPTL